MPLWQSWSVMVPSPCLKRILPLALLHSVSYALLSVLQILIASQVQSNPLDPTFPTIRKNARRSQPLSTITHLYRIYPTVMTSSNAQHSCAGDPALNLNPDGTVVAAQSFSPCFIPVELPVGAPDIYKPLCSQPRVSRLDEAAPIEGSPGFTVAKAVQARIQAEYAEFHEREVAFASNMGRLRILASQNDSPAGPDHNITAPHYLIFEMFRLMHEKPIRRLLNAECTYAGEIVKSLNLFYKDQAWANACADGVLLRALDACAILGGVDLPQWPPNGEWQGATFNRCDVPPPSSTLSENQTRFLATIRRLERWGVPIWNIDTSRKFARVDTTPDGLPSEDVFEERLHQTLLDSLAPKVESGEITGTRVLKLTSRVHTPDFCVAGYSGLPRGSQRYRLQAAICALIDHHSPNHSNFMSFSAIVQDILGPKIWTGNRHEAGLHPPFFDITAQMPWTRVRDAIRECSHLGVNIALFQIPLTWMGPHTSVASTVGTYNATEGYLVSLAACPRGVWYVLEVDDFRKSDEPSAGTLAERFATDGVIGWCFVHSGLQLKDASGKTIPHSRFTLRLLFKEQHVREQVSKSIKADAIMKDHEQRVVDKEQANDDFLFNFHFFVHPNYADIAYAEPISSASRSQIMHYAPLFDVMPSSSGTKDRAAQVKMSVHALRFEELLETKKFPPIITPLSSSASPTPMPRTVGLDMCSCSINMLLQLASSATPLTTNLSFMDVCRMQRFAYILAVLAKHGPFSCRVFSSAGPYVKILRYFVHTIRNTPLPGSSFTSRSSRLRTSPFHEAVRMTNSGNVEIVLNVDEPDPVIHEDEYKQYNATLAKQWEEYSKKPSRSESRREKAARKIAEGIAAGMAGPSRST